MQLIERINENYWLKRFLTRILGLMLSVPVLREMHYRMALRKIRAMPVENAPEVLFIETTNLCNAKCVMCPHGQMTRKAGVMDISLFRKIIDDAVQSGIKVIGLSFFGEPLLDREFFERIEYIKQKDSTIKVFFNTNASKLTTEVSKKLVALGVDEVRISFDAFFKETYEKIRVGLKHGSVIANIEALINLKASLKSEYPIVRLAYVDFNENSGEARSFYRFWSGKADRVEIDFARNWADNKEVLSSESPHLSGIPERNPCRSLWREMVVMYDGRVALCCNDYDGRVVMGDLRRQSILQAWASPVYVAYRNKHVLDQRNSLPYCDKCSKYSFWW